MLIHIIHSCATVIIFLLKVEGNEEMLCKHFGVTWPASRTRTLGPRSCPCGTATWGPGKPKGVSGTRQWGRGLMTQERKSSKFHFWNVPTFPSIVSNKNHFLPSSSFGSIAVRLQLTTLKDLNEHNVEIAKITFPLISLWSHSLLQ